LFEDQVAEAPRPVRDLGFTKQHKFVKLDQKIIEGLVHDVDMIHIQLFSGENVVIYINKRQPINDNDAIAYGEVEGDEGSQVVLSMAGDADGGRTEAKLVGTAKWSGHTSSGNFSSDINALSGNAAIKTLRAQNKADLVAALVPGQASGTTGIGSLPSGTSGNKNACWSVIKVDAVGAPARSFSHEIGHNLGAGHADSSGAESAAKGWRFTGTDGKKYRTLLSYQNEAGEARIPNYSNPSVNFQGMATGTGTANNSATISKIIIKATGYN